MHDYNITPYTLLACTLGPAHLSLELAHCSRHPFLFLLQQHILPLLHIREIMLNIIIQGDLIITFSIAIYFALSTVTNKSPLDQIEAFYSLNPTCHPPNWSRNPLESKNTDPI
jgi:hypothetical protein